MDVGYTPLDIYILNIYLLNIYLHIWMLDIHLLDMNMLDIHLLDIPAEYTMKSTNIVCTNNACCKILAPLTISKKHICFGLKIVLDISVY